MCGHRNAIRVWRRPGGAAMLLTIGLVSFVGSLPGLTASGKAKPAAADRGPVATCVTETGTVICREKLGQPWHVVAHEEKLSSGDLLVGLPGAMLDSQNRAVRLILLSNLAGSSPYPVKEAAVMLHHDPSMDLDMTLDRGRVDLVNRKEIGPAKVRLRVRQETWDLTLENPGASVGLELYGRWPRERPLPAIPGQKTCPPPT